MKSRIRVLLADDHAVVRMGFRLLLQETPDIEVVAEADSGESAYQGFVQHAPDVVVIDISMPGMGGIEAVNRILGRDRQARVLVLSAHEDTMHPKRMLRAGALGYLSKRTAPESLIEAIRTVADGRPFLDAQIAHRLALHDLGGGNDPVERLSEREFEVFLQLARGQSVNQIAEARNISPSTVGTHLYNIKQKLGASNQAELTLIALRHGLIEA
ncbi:MAG TPA: response regulator transcription factor [Burkholderiaceae bacterium]|nr:response regulator transcription factor [Burkholderiaceae bacterium]